MFTLILYLKGLKSIMKEKKLQKDLKTTVRDERLDLIKAISISLVLIWHLSPISIISEETPKKFTSIISFMVTELNVNLTLIAVPLFVLVSLFLTFKKFKRSTSINQYILKRTKRLGEIFLFWTIVQFSVYYSIILINLIKSQQSFSWEIFKFTVRDCLDLLIMGGPSLPLVGGSVFYFLFILIILTLISYFFYICFDKNKYKKSISLLLITFFLIYFAFLNFKGINVPYWRLDNFLIYIPIAYLLANQRKTLIREQDLFLYILYIFFLIFVLQDIFWRLKGNPFSAYLRVSVVSGALAVFINCLNLKRWKNPEIFVFLAKYSLGIFAIHKYCQLISIVIINNLYQLLNINNNWSIFSTSSILIAIMTTLISFGIILLLDKSFFQKFVK